MFSFLISMYYVLLKHENIIFLWTCFRESIHSCEYVKMLLGMFFNCLLQEVRVLVLSWFVPVFPNSF